MSLFPLDPPVIVTTQRHADMLALYGETPDATCRTCAHLSRHSRGTRWLKCDKSNPTASAASDWRAKWKACGLYEKENVNG